MSWIVSEVPDCPRVCIEVVQFFVWQIPRAAKASRFGVFSPLIVD